MFRSVTGSKVEEAVLLNRCLSRCFSLMHGTVALDANYLITCLFLWRDSEIHCTESACLFSRENASQ